MKKINLWREKSLKIIDKLTSRNIVTLSFLLKVEPGPTFNSMQDFKNRGLVGAVSLVAFTFAFTLKPS